MAPTLLEVTGVNAGWIPFALAAFGLGGIVVPFVGIKAIDVVITALGLA